MKSFRTFCIVSLADTEKLNSLLGSEKILLFKPDPTERHWQSTDGKSMTEFTFAGLGQQPPADQILQNEVLFLVEEVDAAENMISTIHGGMLLGYPHPFLTDTTFDIQDLSPEFDDALCSNKWYSQKFRRHDNFYFGILVWQIARADNVLLYTIEKYKLSLSLDSFTPHSANPKYGQLFENYNAEYSYHTKAAFAIIAAFSAIEEMGLEIRSSAQKPRFLDNNSGKWNPVVLSDSNKRLEEIGIKDTERIDWIFRGKPTKVEEELKPYFGEDSEWVDGESVRDKSLSFPEAIHNASYLRNFIASHKFNELTAFISPYDVFNMQNLVRRLLLNKLGL